MTNAYPLDDLIRQEANLIEGALQMQSQGLEILLTEMHALAGMLPGMAFSAGTRTEAETEAGFDNMPV